LYRKNNRGKGKLDPNRSFPVRAFEQASDMTMPESAFALADATGRFPRKLGFTYKKSVIVTGRGHARVKKQRDHRFKHRVPAVSTQPDRVVFVDETSVKTNLTCQREWSPPGARLVTDAPLGSSGTQTFISGRSPGALIAP
jgi:hypothetical protein